MPAPSELAEHSTSVEHSVRPLQPEPSEHPPHQLDLRTAQLWADGWSTLQLHQQRLTPELDGLLTTSVVIPPDSEIVAKFSESGIRPHGCALVQPARCLTEEYGVMGGHTLVDASSGSGSVLIVNPNAEVVVLPVARSSVS